MKNRNIAIGVGIIILLWWLSRKKDTVETMVDEATDGGGGGGGGGFFPSFPIPPIDGGTGTGTTTTTPSGTGANVVKGGRSTTPDEAGTRKPIEDEKPQDVVLAPEFTYTTGFALRPLKIKLPNSTTYRTFAVGSRIEIAQPKLGNNFTHPKLNPAQTLLLGTDVDFSSPSGTTGGLTGGATSGGTSGGIGGGATGGTFSGGSSGTLSGASTGVGIGGGALGGGGIQNVSPTGGSTIPRAGAIGSKSGGSTSAGKAPSGTL